MKMLKGGFILDEKNINGLSEDEQTVEETTEEITEESAEAVVEETAEADIQEVAEADSLTEELEGLRDMFQRELDIATEMAENGELIQELDDESEDAEEEAEEEEKKICECCGECAVSGDYGEDYPYCNACRELMKRYPLRASGAFAILFMVLVFFLSAYVSVDYLDSMTSAIDGDAQYASGKITSAMYSHYSYIGSTEPEKVSRLAVKQLIDCFSKTGYTSEAESLIETFFTEDELKLPWNKKYKNMLSFCKNIEETYYAVTGEVGDALNGAKFDYEEHIAKLDALLKTNPKEEGKSETVEAYNEVFIEYYKYVLMSMSGKSYEEQLEQLAYIESIDKYDMQWAYLSNYCAIAARCHNLELTEELFERLLEINTEDTNAYVALASYYRFAETPDADKMIEICNEAAENVSANDNSYRMTLAIAYLLKGEGALALEEMEAFMATANTVQGCNLYALCGLYNGNKEIYKEMKSLLESYGYEIGEVVEKYKAGKISITEALQDMGGDI